MSYALPSMTRVPAAEKGLTIADFLVPVRLGERVSPRLRNVVLVVAGAVLIYLTALISFPREGSQVPYTLQTFGVLVVGGGLGMRRGFLAALLYLVVGLVGVPFFAEHKGGVQVVLGATGGYLVGFVARRRPRRSACGARLGSADRRRDRRHGARHARDLRGRRAVARGDHGDVAWATRSRTACCRSSPSTR